jgi:hypothetical protein
VALYTNALPVSVIQAHYKNGTNRSPSDSYAALARSCGPFSYFRLDETSFACEFDPSFGGYVDCTAHAGLNINGPMSAIAWIKATRGVNRFQTFLGRSDLSWRGSVNWYGIMRWTAGNANPDAVGQSRVNDGAWHFFAGAYNGRMNSAYVDGKLEATVAASSSIAGSDGKTLIGTVGDYLHKRQFQGSVAQVAILTNALRAEDILRIYHSAEPTPSTDK